MGLTFSGIKAIAIMMIAMAMVGCGNEAPKTENAKIETTKTQITRSDARTKLKELSRGLEIRYDDMTEHTYYHIHTPNNHPMFFIPYVSVDKDFNVSLALQIFSISHYPLYFDKLFIKSANGVSSFTISKVRKSNYNEIMTEEIYKTIKDAVKSKYLKYRVTGNDIGEREMTQKELSEISAVFSIYEYFQNVQVAKK